MCYRFYSFFFEFSINSINISSAYSNIISIVARINLKIVQFEDSTISFLIFTHLTAKNQWKKEMNWTKII